MGCDVHIVLGRINLQAIANRPATTSDSTALVLFGHNNIEAEDFAFEEVPRDYDLYRNYQLFSWLGVARGDLRPYYEGSERNNRTEQFLDWLDRKLLESARKEKGLDSPAYFSSYGDSIHDRYYMGDHSRIIFGVKTLVEFNYDNVVERENPATDWNSPVYTYYRDPEGRTYREVFGDQYFKFLDYCVRENWHFVIFGFDS